MKRIDIAVVLIQDDLNHSERIEFRQTIQVEVPTFADAARIMSGFHEFIEKMKALNHAGTKLESSKR